MRMRRQIDRHVVDEDRQVRAVIEIVAAQVILIGLAAIGMHDDREARRGFENFAGACDRTSVQVLPRDRHLACHRRPDRRTAGDIGRAGVVRRRYGGWGSRRSRGLGFRAARTRLGVRRSHADGRKRRAFRCCPSSAAGGVCAVALTQSDRYRSTRHAKKRDAIKPSPPQPTLARSMRRRYDDVNKTAYWPAHGVR